MKFFSWRDEKLLREQWPEALLFLSEALKSGMGLEEALETLRCEAPEPLRSKMENAWAPGDGLPLEMRIDRLLSGTDLALARVVLLLSYQTGGKAAGLVEKTALILKEKLDLAEKVKIMTAQGRVSAWIVGLSPFALLLGFVFFSPDYVAPLFQTKAGLVTLACMVALTVAGLFLVHRAARLEP